MAKKQITPEETEFFQRLGMAIKVARIERRLTQLDLCDLAHIAPPTIYHVETGVKPTSMSTYLKVMKILGLTFEIKKVDQQ